MSTFLYVGRFTKGEPRSERAEGISVFRLEASSGSLRLVQTVGGLVSPSYLALHPRLPVLYAVEREWSAEEAHEGALTAFAIDRRDGRIRLLGRQPGHGPGDDLPAG